VSHTCLFKSRLFCAKILARIVVESDRMHASGRGHRLWSASREVLPPKGAQFCSMNWRHKAAVNRLRVVGLPDFVDLLTLCVDLLILSSTWG
jgi:hypothetical protein